MIHLIQSWNNYALKARKLARHYNLTDEDECEKQYEILKELLPNTREMPLLQAPVYFDYGCNTYFGKYSGANFNFTCLDVCPVHIGDNVMIGLNVTLATPMHPLLLVNEIAGFEKMAVYIILNMRNPLPLRIIVG